MGHKFELLTDEQVLTEIYEGRLTGSFPLCSVNYMLHSTTPKLIETTLHRILICEFAPYP